MALPTENLSGPDAMPQPVLPVLPVPLPRRPDVNNGGSLNSATDEPHPVRPVRPASGGTTLIDTSGGHSIVDDATPGFWLTGGGGGIGVLAITDTPPTPLRRTSAYDFYGTMTEEQLHLYLERSMDMCGVSSWRQGGVLAYSGAPNTDTDHDNQVQMILNVGAKFVGGMASFWPNADKEPDLTIGLDQFRIDVDFLHSVDPDIICEGRVWEAVGSEVSTIIIPDYVFIDFGMSPSRSQFFFDYNINYIDSTAACSDFPRLDISRREAQMWYYYLATRMIDNGAESIHFGDIYEISCNDPGNAGLWNVVSLVRKYAAGTNLSNSTGRPNARRALVLCNAHVNLSELGGNTRNTIYYDPPGEAVRTWDRQLIFDFHCRAIQAFAKEYLAVRPSPDFLPSRLNPFAPEWTECISGGLHPLGYFCAHNACTINNDNGMDTERPSYAGVSWYDTSGNDWTPFWGYDFSSWFLQQSSYWKDRIIPYLYFGIKCMTPYTHYYMPGRLFSSVVRSTVVYGAHLYTANNFGQDIVIADTWNDLPPIPLTPNDWVYHDFTYENVMNGDGYVGSNLIFVGDDKMFFIGPDNWIHGYIKVNGNYNGGTWLTVSPSAAAHSSGQVPAKSDLVASPDGNWLLYIGVDNYIHGFEIIDAWTYRYIFSNEAGNYIPRRVKPAGSTYNGFMVKPMMDQRITAVGGLIFPTNDSIYYIGRWDGDGTQFVHGFQQTPGRAWYTVSPSYAADGTGIPSQSIHVQMQAAGALTYDGVAGRLYYRTLGFRRDNGLIAYFEIRSLTDYYYVECPGNSALTAQRLEIVGNFAIHHHGARTIIYYVARYLPYREDRVHCMVQEPGGGWHTNSPSYIAASAGSPVAGQAISNATGMITVSPDGTTIAWYGTDGAIHYFSNIDDVYYSYGSFAAGIYPALNSLQFTPNSDLYWIRPDMPSVRRMVYQLAFCENLALTNYP